MKLYLSSYRIPDLEKFCSFIGKDAKDIKFGLVLNAKDYKPKEERGEKAQELMEYFSGFGFKVDEINLKEYFSKNILEKFSDYDVVWFNGGNTYMLRSIVEKIGGKEKITKMLNNGVVYGGDSAGAIIVGPTLNYFSGADDPSVVSEVIYEGLNIIDFCVVPHWESDEFGEIVSSIKEKLDDDGFKTIKLTDDEFLLVEDGKIIK